MNIAAIQALDARLKSITDAERRGLVQFLRHLDALDREGGYDLFGCSSTFWYLVKEHHLAEGTAWRRVTAMNLVRRFPQLEAAIEDGRLNSTQLGILARVLTAENAEEVMRAAAHRTKAETEELAVSIVPRTAPAPGLRKAPAPRATMEPPQKTAAGFLSPVMGLPQPISETAPTETAHARVELARPKARITPVARGEWLNPIRLDEQMMRDQRELTGLLAHQIPDGDPIEIYRQMLKDSLATQRRKHGFSDPLRQRKPSPPRPPTPGARAPIRKEVRREVLRRDGYRCTWIYPDGSRCSCASKLEMDHVDAPARETGSSEVEDLTTRCNPHNMLAALRRFGREYVLRRIEEARRERDERRASPDRQDGLMQ